MAKTTVRKMGAWGNSEESAVRTLKPTISSKIGMKHKRSSFCVLVLSAWEKGLVRFVQVHFCTLSKYFIEQDIWTSRCRHRHVWIPLTLSFFNIQQEVNKEEKIVGHHCGRSNRAPLRCKPLRCEQTNSIEEKGGGAIKKVESGTTTC